MVEHRFEQLRHDAVRHWMRKKNFAILLFLILYALTRVLLHYREQYAIPIPEGLLIGIGALPLIFLTLFFTNIILRVLSPSLSKFFRDELEPEQRIFFVKIVEIAAYGCAVVFLLYSFGATASSLTILIGFISGGIAFGLRDTILSFVMWLIILTKKPFRLGDNIRIGDYEGRVERIGTFFLTITSAGKLSESQSIAQRTVKIPNTLVFQLAIENYGNGSIPQTLRLQLRTLPKELEASLREVRVLATDLLRRSGIESEVSVSVENQNASPNDRQYIVISYAAPLRERENVRTRLLTTLLSKQRKLFTD